MTIKERAERIYDGIPDSAAMCIEGEIEDAMEETAADAFEQAAAFLRDLSSKADYLGVSIALHEASVKIRAMRLP